MKVIALKVALVTTLTAALFILGCIVSKNVNTPLKTAVEPDKRYGAIVRLVRDNHTFCTGTVISTHIIITAAHCVLMETPFGLMGSGDIEIRPSENVVTNTVAKLVNASPQMDQAILTGDFRKYQTKRVITDPHKLAEVGQKGNNYISCGYPLNGDIFCNITIFDKNDNFFWAVNGVLIPGMSGGPTMLPDGTVVAVNTAVQGPNSIVSPIYNILRSLAGK